MDRSKEFYVDRLGFALDVDHRGSEAFRVVQVTPPGSACSVTFGTGLGGGEPGSVKGLQVVVTDIEAARVHLEKAGVPNEGVQHFVDGVMTPGPDPTGADYGSFLFFADPDGSSWAIQQVVAPVR